MSKEITKSEKPKYKICEVCGERVKAQGYGGHLFLKHDIKTGITARLEEVQGRLDKIENSDGNSDQDPDLKNCLEVVGTLSDNLKSAEERIKLLEDFISSILWDPNDKTLWMEEKGWNKSFSFEREEEDQEKKEDNPESDEEDEDNPEPEEKENPGPTKKLSVWDKITKAIGLFEVEE